MADAIKRGGELARNQMVSVSLKDVTIPHEVYSHYGGAKILLRPASPGTGIIAGKTVRAVLESAGMKDILSKSLGSNNAANVVKATLKAFVEPAYARRDLQRPRFGNQKSQNARTAVGDSANSLKFLCDYTILNLVPARSIAPNGLVRANPAATAKLPVAAAKARRRVPAVPSASVLKAARCRSSAAFPNAVSTMRGSRRNIIGVNVGDLNKFDDGARVDETALRSIGLANGRAHGIKILGNGELSKKLTVIVSAFSASAKAKIEAKGGACEIVTRKPGAPAKA